MARMANLTTGGETANPRNLIWQTLVVLHRYLGVAVGLLMVMWFVSGIVMMYVGLPRVTDEERARTLEPIAWQACCHFPPRLAPDNAQLFGAQVENVAGAPVMRLRPAGRAGFVLDLEQCAVVRVDAEAAQEIVLAAAPRIIGHPAKLIGAAEIESDQWTLGRLRRERPLFRFAFDDPEKTNIYVSGSNAQVVHWTTATERFWSWLGAIPHWLYFAQLRSNVVLWTEIMIWTSVLGTFLTVLGLYLGITQFKARARFSPYRGWFYLHHIAGLVFGVTTLTFVVSGLISSVGFSEAHGNVLTLPNVSELLQHPAHGPISSAVVRIQRPKQTIGRSGNSLSSVPFPKAQGRLFAAEHGREIAL
jgi:hypothetical protein